MGKPKLLICTPELVIDLPEGMGNLAGRVLNFKTGGMADVNSTIIKELAKDKDIELYVTMPYWKSSLRALSDLTEHEITEIRHSLPSHNFHPVEHASFNRVTIRGTNTMMYDDTHRFTSIDRALAFDNAVINWLIPHIKPDVIWVSDWMLGLVPPYAKAHGIKSLSTAHNIFTKYIHLDDIIKSGIDAREFKGYLYYGRHENKDKVDLLTTEIFASDYFTTVSPTFLRELYDGQHNTLIPDTTFDEIKCKVDAARAKGILNPRQEKYSQFLNDIREYGIEEVIRQRKRNAKDLRARVGLKKISSPLIIYPNRLFRGQKNPDFALSNAQALVQKYKVQFLFLANGSKDLEDWAISTALNSDGMIAYRHFDSKLEELALKSDRVYGFMTSDYEPCGKPNIVYPGEGVIIIGHRVGGIADSVQDLEWVTRGEQKNVIQVNGNGIPYDVNDWHGLKYAFGKLTKFDKLPDNIRYSILKKIAERNLIEHSIEKRMQEYKDIIFMLYEEKMREKK